MDTEQFFKEINEAIETGGQVKYIRDFWPSLSEHRDEFFNKYTLGLDRDNWCASLATDADDSEKWWIEQKELFIEIMESVNSETRIDKLPAYWWGLYHLFKSEPEFTKFSVYSKKIHSVQHWFVKRKQVKSKVKKYFLAQDELKTYREKKQCK